VIWKRLEHQNIVPLLGIASTPLPGITSTTLQLISEWMPGGVLTEHVKNNPDADRPRLVGVPPVEFSPTLTPTTSYLMLRKAFVFFTPAA